MNRKIINVYIDKGYLTLDSERALDLFNDQVESGLIWQFISQLFNDYARSPSRDEELTAKLDALIEVQKLTLERLSVSNKLVSNTETFIEPKESVVKTITVERKPVKPNGSLFGGLTNKFKDFKD